MIGAIASEIAMLLGYEALKDLETENVEVETPLEKNPARTWRCRRQDIWNKGYMI